ncbi:UNVERIFIED_CONTAM: hypothetical protein Sangu_0063200 [Sesamum angustifolium]|uniref:Uncharacterized protein n=1 Tax=Sesamum angustifolium TaxID=2727405 RepID=A0AAW2RIU7_9LAMI
MQARLAEVNSMIGNNSRNGFVDKDAPGLSPMIGQFPSSSMVVFEKISLSTIILCQYGDGKHLESADDASRYVQDNDPKQVRSLTRSVANNENLLRTIPDIDRNVAGHIMENMPERNGYFSGSEQRTTDQFSHPPMMHDGVGSFDSEEDGPGIEGFQITGDAKPGCKLLGCGYPVRGTSLCMFQWVRHYPDGTRQYIEGATNPDYVVTADDVDKLIAVECIPMDEQGRQGDLVRIFANDHNKITCDEEMQQEIDTYISKGLAIFNVLILLDSSENWEPATLFMRRSGFQVKVERNQDVVISEKYSKDLLIQATHFQKLNFAQSSEFSDMSNKMLSYLPRRMRDTLVLTMRIFQGKASDEKRKSKA